MGPLSFVHDIADFCVSVSVQVHALLLEFECSLPCAGASVLTRSGCDASARNPIKNRDLLLSKDFLNKAISNDA